MLQLCLVFLVFGAKACCGSTATDDGLKNFMPGNGYLDEFPMHNHRQHHEEPSYHNPREATKEFWNAKAQSSLEDRLSKTPNTNVAKNIILFVGDGMSIPTLAAARTYLGQRNGQPGEETELSFEKFPFSGLSKTYCVDAQVADSACSATAYLGGVKANEGTAGITASVPRGDCPGMVDEKNHVYSLAYWSQLKGKRTGLVTTTRVTHASPSAVYAHIADRTWESDTEILLSGRDPTTCPDIAQQMIHSETGRNLNVILGGGRGKFLPFSPAGEEGRGSRLDGRNLITEWKASRQNTKHRYVNNLTTLLQVPDETDNLLGLFHKSHIPYNMERETQEIPSLAEMTQAAIRTLSRGEDGFFLFVEGGRIDHAHHTNWAKKALDETIEFHKAVEAATQMTKSEETLIVVTSDHSHTMTMNGYPKRGNDILGIADKGIDGLPYATLSYANGLGYRREKDGRRHDVSKDNMGGNYYFSPALAPVIAESHGGDDVGIFAQGPWAHLLSGVVEQNVIPHVMAYAACVGDGLTVCKTKLDF